MFERKDRFMHMKGVNLSQSVPEKRDRVIMNREEYLSQLNDTVRYIDSTVGKGGWGIIGGIAKDALTGNKDFEVFDEKNGLRDIDIVLKDGGFEKFENLRENNPNAIPIGGFINRMMDFRGDDVLLHLGNASERVPSSVFSTENLSIGEVEFPSFPPETLLHMYVVRGKMRANDFLAALEIGRYINRNGGATNERMYRGFHNFSKKISKGEDFATLLHKACHLYGEIGFDRIVKLNNPHLRGSILKIWDLIERN